MPKLQIVASSDSVPRARYSTHVPGFYNKLSFELEFTGWKQLRVDIQKEVAKRYGDGERRWIWGLYGKDGQSQQYVLYDSWELGACKRKQAEYRQSFEAKMQASTRTPLQVKVKWSFKEQAVEVRSAQKNAQIAHGMLHGGTGGEFTPIESQERPKFYFTVRTLQQTTDWLLSELLEGPDFGDERQEREQAGLPVVLPLSGAKSYVPPEVDEAVMKCLEQEGVPLKASDVILGDDKVAKLDDVIATAKHAHGRTRSSSHGRGSVKAKPHAEGLTGLAVEMPELLQEPLGFVIKKNTFVYVPLPNSMRSASSAQPVTI